MGDIYWYYSTGRLTVVGGDHSDGSNNGPLAFDVYETINGTTSDLGSSVNSIIATFE